MSNKKISVSEALQRLEAGQPISDYVVDFDRIKVEALDVMKLAKAGIVVPEEAIYYNDDELVEDEDFEGNWIRVPTEPLPAAANPAEVQIMLREDIQQWLLNNQVNLNQLIEQLLDSFYRAQKIVSEGSKRA